MHPADVKLLIAAIAFIAAATAAHIYAPNVGFPLWESLVGTVIAIVGVLAWLFWPVRKK
ncbi:hypothetical protein [Variibacter gotjawalensis]|uniref:hypothetical protein n=1 Tax=Variibacter gotjawalensis TaxID=1333996 RepID=UPI0012FE5C64|nr:hypothetical protein [Variibacter gotjawalensis]NIK47855.1 preprotein translocase subunit Sec61beta [Variibacter gotjawalensis]